MRKDVYGVSSRKSIVIGEKLRRCRTNCGLSQQQVADVLGVNRATYTYYEVGRNEPSLKTIVKLAQLFCVDASALLPGENADILLRDTDTDSDAPNPIYSLTRDEQNLLLSFRLLKDEDKADVLAKITNMAKQAI